MKKQSIAKIFLADERGCDESDWYRSYSTFNSGKYFHEFKNPFYDLCFLNDDTLEGGACFHMNIEESSVMLLIPVVGTVSYKDTCNNYTSLDPGQIQFSYLHKGTKIEIFNPYEAELINFLHLRLKAGIFKSTDKPIISGFDLNQSRNHFIELTPGKTADTTDADLVPIVLMGKFSGREEAVYKLKNKDSRLFVFVIEGVFEVQGRLLHARDGLGLSDVAEDIELEALSNEAIVMMIEF